MTMDINESDEKDERRKEREKRREKREVKRRERREDKRRERGEGDTSSEAVVRTAFELTTFELPPVQREDVSRE